MSEPKVLMSEEVAEGCYINVTRCFTGQSEFTIDFGRMLSESNTFKVYTRILMTPRHAQALMQSIGIQLEKLKELTGEEVAPSSTVIFPKKEPS